MALNLIPECQHEHQKMKSPASSCVRSIPASVIRAYPGVDDRIVAHLGRTLQVFLKIVDPGVVQIQRVDADLKIVHGVLIRIIEACDENESVGARAPIELIVAVIAVQEVIVGSAPQGVIAVTAVEFIGAGTGLQGIVAVTTVQVVIAKRRSMWLSALSPRTSSSPWPVKMFSIPIRVSSA